MARKFESVEEYLARGGVITYLRPEESGLDPFYGVPKKKVRRRKDGKAKNVKHIFNEDIAK